MADPTDIMGTASVEQGIRWQAEHGLRNDAPITGRICMAMLALMHGDTATGRRIAAWPGAVLEDALPLRLAAGFHYLHLTDDEPRLAPVYAGDVTDQAAVDAIVLAVTRDHDAWLLPWLDGPPQTNEAGAVGVDHGGVGVAVIAPRSAFRTQRTGRQRRLQHHDRPLCL